MNGSDVITAAVRGIAPYAIIGGLGYVGYRVLKKRGVFDDLGEVVDSAAGIPSKIVNTFRNRTGMDSFERGDWIGGAQQIVRNFPVVAAGEAAYNAIKPEPKIAEVPDPTPNDNNDTWTTKDAIAYDLNRAQESINVDESVWQDTPLKYVPAVAVRNAITKIWPF